MALYDVEYGKGASSASILLLYNQHSVHAAAVLRGRRAFGIPTFFYRLTRAMSNWMLLGVLRLVHNENEDTSKHGLIVARRHHPRE